MDNEKSDEDYKRTVEGLERLVGLGVKPKDAFEIMQGKKPYPEGLGTPEDKEYVTSRM